MLVAGPFGGQQVRIPRIPTCTPQPASETNISSTLPPAPPPQKRILALRVPDKDPAKNREGMCLVARTSGFPEVVLLSSRIFVLLLFFSFYY